MRTKTLDSLLKKVLITLFLVSFSSFCVLVYLFFFNRVKLLVGLLYPFPAGLYYLSGLGPLTMGLLLSIDYTPLGLILGGWLVVSTNPVLRFLLELLLLVPFTVIFMFVPLGLFTSLGRYGGYEKFEETVYGFKSKIWSEKKGKRTVIFMMVTFAVMYMLGLFIFLSGFYIIQHVQAIIMTFVFFIGVTGLINIQFVTSYWRIRDQKLQVKQDSVKPKNT